MEDYLLMNEAVQDSQVITRFSPPGPWDMLPKGTIITVIQTDPFQEEFYIQRNSDDSKPIWEKI